MQRNNLVSTLITLMCFIGITNAACASPITTNSFYVGSDIGAGDFMTKESHSVASESHQLGSIGTVGGVFFGYDFGINNRVRLAVEIFGEAANQSIKISHGINTYKIEQDYNMGIRALPEFVFTPFTLGHIILGYVSTARFQIHDNGVYGIINTSYIQNGFQTGVGFTTTLSDRISFRLDALYDAYPSNTRIGTGLATPTQSYTNRFSQFACEVGLIYRFN